MKESVYRTELTPVSFLERSVSVFPDKTAVVHGAIGSTPMLSWQSACTVSLPVCVALASRSMIVLASCASTPPTYLRHISLYLLPGASWWL